ncbi:glycosyltransferase [Patescibacteria group bacterium]
MKVLMQGRFDLQSGGGGDKVQIENTAEELRSLGVEVDVVYNYVRDYSPYDLVHVFQLDWTPETHFFAREAKRVGLPLCFSPIHHNVKEVKRCDDECVYDYRRFSKFLFGNQHKRDTFKNVYRSFLNPKKVGPTFHSVFKGLKNMHVETLTLSDAILVQTELEAKDLKETYGVDFKWFKVPNGVGEQFFHLEGCQNPLPFDNYIFSVGRIEPRKNQLNIIKAVESVRQEYEEDIQLVFVGTKNMKNHLEYTLRFNCELKKNPWITVVDYVPNRDIPAYFKFAKVCVSASWFETTGLTLLEALFCETNAVASSPRAKEILGDLASYCDPGDLDSISEGIKKEFKAPRPSLSPGMKAEYTWENAAKKTLEVYSSFS